MPSAFSPTRSFTKTIANRLFLLYSTSSMKDLSQVRSLRFEATPFHPHLYSNNAMTKSSNDENPSYEFAIYNDGKPCMMATSEAQVNNILHGIPDESLDENFPPDARDAAELEDVDAFNEMQALFDLMEERDEEARESYSHVGKRWESRRREGIAVGQKPKEAHVLTAKEHGKTMIMPQRKHFETQAIESHSHRNYPNKVIRNMEGRRPDRPQAMGRKSKGMFHHGPREARIQQPRK